MLGHGFQTFRAQSADPTLVSKDEWQGTAPDAHTGVLGVAVLSKSAAYTILPADLAGWGLLVIGDASGGSFTVTLPKLSAAGRGVTIRFKKHGGTNTFTFARQGSDSIYSPTGVVTSLGLTTSGESRSVISTASFWEFAS